VYDSEGKRKYLSFSEREAFREAATELADLQERTLCLTLLNTGCRISEALNTLASHLDIAEQKLVFETLKRRKNGVFRAIPIPDDLCADLLALTSGRDPSTPIWGFSRTSAWRLIKQTMKSAQIVGNQSSPRGLRHGFGIACVSHGVPVTTIQKWMGHARLETTAIYLSVTGHEERQFARRIWGQEQDPLKRALKRVAKTSGDT
jgi:integrase